MRDFTPHPWGKLTHTVTTYPEATLASKFQIQVNMFQTLKL